MSTLLLDEQKPLFALSKTTNTFSSRHHIRVFETSETWDGRTVLTASSTQDIGIAFSAKPKTFIHVIDQYLDNERSKVTNVAWSHVVRPTIRCSIFALAGPGGVRTSPPDRYSNCSLFPMLL